MIFCYGVFTKQTPLSSESARGVGSSLCRYSSPVWLCFVLLESVQLLLRLFGVLLWNMVHELSLTTAYELAISGHSYLWMFNRFWGFGSMGFFASSLLSTKVFLGGFIPCCFGSFLGTSFLLALLGIKAPAPASWIMCIYTFLIFLQFSPLKNTFVSWILYFLFRNFPFLWPASFLPTAK